MPPQRILFVIPTLGGGGAERVLVGWLEDWKKDPWPMTPAIAFSLKKEGPFLEDVDPAIPTYELGQDPDAPWDIFLKAWRLARIYRKFKPDLVVSIIAHANIMALLAARLFARDVPIIICEQTCLSENIFDFYPRLGFALKALIRWLYPQARRIVAISHGVKDDLVQSFGVDQTLIDVVYNAVDPAEIQRLSQEPVEWPVPDSVPAILGIGRLMNQKGFVHLIRALALVRRDIPAHLVIVGDGPQRKRLEAEAQRLGLTEVVHFLGFKKNPIKYMRRADVFAFPSLYEGMGVVLLEALAVGMPVVATCCPHGPYEIIRDGVHGLLVPVGNEAELAQALLRVFGDPELCRRLGEQARQRVMDFTLDVHRRAYREIFVKS